MYVDLIKRLLDNYDNILSLSTKYTNYFDANDNSAFLIL